MTNLLVAAQTQITISTPVGVGLGYVNLAREFLMRAWAGVCPQATAYAVQLMTAQGLRGILERPIFELFGSGTTGHVVLGSQSLAMASWASLPAEVVKTAKGAYAMRHRGLPPSNMWFLKQILLSKGPLGFYAGFAPITCRCSIIGGSWGLGLDKHSQGDAFAAWRTAVLAGGFGGFVTSPFDQARALIQQHYNTRAPALSVVVRSIVREPRHALRCAGLRAVRMSAAISFITVTDPIYTRWVMDPLLRHHGVEVQ
eukprot:EG_transcript_17024